MANENEIGYQAEGILSWGNIGAQAHETNPDLEYPLSIEVYDRMRSEDSQVGSVLRAVILPIIRADWMIDPAGASPEVVDHIATDLGLPIKGQAFTAPLRTRDRFEWGDHLRLALLELVFGHSIFEQVYRAEAGRIHLRKLAWRPPRTIADFKIASDGGLVSIEQRGTFGKGAVVIPVDRLVVYVNEREGGNWLGRSLLRTAYKNWLLKDRLLRVQALSAERNGLGVPVYTASDSIPEGLTPEQHKKWLADERKSGLTLTKGFRAGETAGASIPGGAKMELLGVSGKTPDTGPMIQYHDEQIARAVLAHFLNLGSETGSWALGSTFANFFTDSLNAVAQHIAEVTQQHVIEDLVDLNWGPSERAPRIVPATIGSEHPATAEAIKALIECKALTVDASLEAHLRNLYGLPVADPQPAEAEGLTDAEEARAAAEVVQKVYLGVGPVIDQDEARAIVDRAGGQLKKTQSQEAA
ncbi:DUF935 family protein [uncultured Microbacterium sp.]|uniref:phage portal protein family protein n=1 Tax=uncultured Microbacterium sp. TaxID=191216 RepID=UPI0025E3F7E1|nr:DUF935 family protein [uncultured Microbacterium sp.]